MAAGCGKSKDSAEGNSEAKTAETAAGKTAEKKDEVPTLTINEAEWVEKNLHEISPLIHVTVKAPKDATFEKNGNGGVDIKFAKFYMVTVGNLAVSNLKEAVEWGESSSIGDSSFKDGVKLLDEESGFVFTYQMNDEANGITYDKESHFYHFIEKDGAIYSFNDTKPMDAYFDTPGAAFSEDLAKQVYGLIKASAKAN